jgi:hypothetical protein
MYFTFIMMDENLWPAMFATGDIGAEEEEEEEEEDPLEE